jgi:hypothetical protein
LDIVIAVVLVVLMLLFVGAVTVLGHFGSEGFKYYLGRYLPGNPNEVRDPVIAAEQRLKALSAVARAGKDGATDAQLADSLRTSVDYVRFHRIELVKAGWIEDSGQRRAWALGSDAAGILWRVTDRGRAELNNASSRPPGADVRKDRTARAEDAGRDSRRRDPPAGDS